MTDPVWTILMPVSEWSPLKRVTETPDDIIKDKLQTRKILQIETVSLILPSKDASNSNLEIFSTEMLSELNN